MTLVTLWFVSSAEPRTCLNAERQADRGFARKYLAQLNPTWPLTHIGDFDMTRSARPGDAEFYIGGFPGLSVVQTIIPGLKKLSELPERYRNLVNAPDVYATCVVADPEAADSPIVGEGGDPVSDKPNSTFGGFAHWRGGTLKRSFTATRETVYEDIGLPCEFEAPFWEGTPEGINLPFVPAEIAAAAAEFWLGFPVSAEGPEIPIAAFAVDGRPEAKSSEYDGLSHGISPKGSDAALFDEEQGYDDYAGPASEKEPSSSEVARTVLSAVVRGTGAGVKRAWHGVRTLSTKIGDEARRRARNN